MIMISVQMSHLPSTRIDNTLYQSILKSFIPRLAFYSIFPDTFSSDSVYDLEERNFILKCLNAISNLGAITRNVPVDQYVRNAAQLFRHDLSAHLRN